MSQSYKISHKFEVINFVIKWLEKQSPQYIINPINI